MSRGVLFAIEATLRFDSDGGGGLAIEVALRFDTDGGGGGRIRVRDDVGLEILCSLLIVLDAGVC